MRSPASLPARAGSCRSRRRAGPRQVAVAGGLVFVTGFVDHTVETIDPRTARPVGRPLPAGLNPFAIAGDSQHVWVTALGTSSVTRLDLADHRSRRLTSPSSSARSASAARFWFCGRSLIPNASNSSCSVPFTVSTLITSSSAICRFDAGAA